jgi:hypothetical protein
VGLFVMYRERCVWNLQWHFHINVGAINLYPILLLHLHTQIMGGSCTTVFFVLHARNPTLWRTMSGVSGSHSCWNGFDWTSVNSTPVASILLVPLLGSHSHTTVREPVFVKDLSCYKLVIDAIATRGRRCSGVATVGRCCF